MANISLACYGMSEPSPQKMQLALACADKVMQAFPELPQDKIEVTFRNYSIIRDRTTNAAAFASAGILLGIIE